MKVIIEHTEEEKHVADFIKFILMDYTTESPYGDGGKPIITLTTRITDKHGAFILEEK